MVVIKWHMGYVNDTAKQKIEEPWIDVQQNKKQDGMEVAATNLAQDSESRHHHQSSLRLSYRRTNKRARVRRS